MMPAPIDISKTISKRFIPRKIEFSSYEVDYKDVKGQLLIIGLLTSVLEIPKNQLPPNIPTPELPFYLITTQGIVSFVNEGKKSPPGPVLTQEQIQKAPKEDITGLVIDSAHEPFNEYLVSGNPSVSLKTRTTLVKIEVLQNTINAQGDPMLWVSQNTTHNVSVSKSGEAGHR
jgi:hypothetical protein